MGGRKDYCTSLESWRTLGYQGTVGSNPTPSSISMVLHSFTNDSGRAYMLRVEPGDGVKKDKLCLVGVASDGKTSPMAAIFHGDDALRLVLRELQEGLKKYDAWKHRQVPSVDGETRRIEVGV